MSKDAAAGMPCVIGKQNLSIKIANLQLNWRLAFRAY
jgi:hypothetical protein